MQQRGGRATCFENRDPFSWAGFDSSFFRMINEVKRDAWQRFLDEAVDFGSDRSNFRFDFATLTRKYGNAYIAYCRAAWSASELSEEEFIQLNGQMPRKFFDSRIRR